MNTCQHCGATCREDLAAGLCPTCLIKMAQQDRMSAGGSLGKHRSAPLSVHELQGRIPGIEIVQCIGQGGMGAVYRAFQIDLDRPVAVKILPLELAQDPVFVERFRQEARALARIDHPNIVRIFGSGVSGDLCYIVMELVEGVTLRDAITQRSVDSTAALRIIPQICSALEYAHGHGIVHRDIKPENILLGQGGKVKVADFGLAKLSAEPGSLSLTRTGAALGTFRYMAPEQFDGESVDHRSDIYALGVVIYELLTGRVPMGHFPPPSETPGVDQRIDAVVMRTLQREPAQRYQSAAEIETDLYKISKGQSPARAAVRSNSNYQNHRLLPGREWKSRSTFFGYPLVHIAYGYDQVSRKKLVARGVIAIGDVAVGGLAIGGAAFGLLSLGGFALGLTAIGGAAIGLQAAYGGAAVGGMAIGGGAIGLLALGGGAIGMVAMGGGAIGYFASGGGAKGAYTYDHRGWSDPTFPETWLGDIVTDPLFGYSLAVAMIISVLGPLLLVFAAFAVGYLTSSGKRSIPNPLPGDVKVGLLQNSAAMIGLVIGAAFIVQLPFRVTSQLQSAMQAIEARRAADQAQAASQALREAQQEINASPPHTTNQ